VPWFESTWYCIRLANHQKLLEKTSTSRLNDCPGPFIKDEWKVQTSEIEEIGSHHDSRQRKHAENRRRKNLHSSLRREQTAKGKSRVRSTRKPKKSQRKRNQKNAANGHRFGEASHPGPNRLEDMVQAQMCVFDTIQESGIFTVWGGSPDQPVDREAMVKQVRKCILHDYLLVPGFVDPALEVRVDFSCESKDCATSGSDGTDHGEGKGTRFGEAEHPGPGATQKRKKQWRVKEKPVTAHEQGGNRDPPELECQRCELGKCHLPNHRHQAQNRRGKKKGQQNSAKRRILKKMTVICAEPEWCKNQSRPHLHCVEASTCRELCCSLAPSGNAAETTAIENTVERKYLSGMAADFGIYEDELLQPLSAGLEPLRPSVSDAEKEDEFDRLRDQFLKKNPAKNPRVREEEKAVILEDDDDGYQAEVTVNESTNMPPWAKRELREKLYINRRGIVPERVDTGLLVFPPHGGYYGDYSPPIVWHPPAVYENLHSDVIVAPSCSSEYPYVRTSYVYSPPVLHLEELNLVYLEEKHNGGPPPLEEEFEGLDAPWIEADCLPIPIRYDCMDWEEVCQAHPLNGFELALAENLHILEDIQGTVVSCPDIVEKPLAGSGSTLVNREVLPPIDHEAPECVQDRVRAYVPSTIDHNVWIPAHMDTLDPESFHPDFSGYFDYDGDDHPVDGEFDPTVEDATLHLHGDPVQKGILGSMKRFFKRLAPYTLADVRTTTQDKVMLSSTIGYSWTLLSSKVFLRDTSVAKDYYLTLGLKTVCTQKIFKKFAQKLLAATKSLPCGARVLDGDLSVNGNFGKAMDFHIRKSYPSFFVWMRNQVNTSELMEAYNWTLCYLAVETAVMNLKATASENRAIVDIKHLKVGIPKETTIPIGVTKTFTGQQPFLETYRDNGLFVKKGHFSSNGLLDYAKITEHVKRKQRPPRSYVSSDGGVVHSATVPAKTIIQMTCALSRLTNAVEPGEEGYHEHLMVNSYAAWDNIDLEKFYDFSEYAKSLEAVKFDFGELYDEAKDHPVKRMEYTQCVETNALNGVLMNPEIESDARGVLNAGKQKDEPLKFNSEARLYVTIGPKGAMIGSKASKVLKSVRASEPVLVNENEGATVGAIYFIPRTDRFSLNEFARLCHNGTRGHIRLEGGNPLPLAREIEGSKRYIILVHSDDTWILLEQFIDGAWRDSWFTVDISKCDKSHAGIFDHFWKFWKGRPDLYEILEAQLKRSIRVEIGNTKIDAWLEPRSLVLLSGHSFTTFINTFASDFMAINFITKGCTTVKDFIYTAYSVGYKIKCAQQERCSDTDFLKHSPGYSVTGTSVAIPFLGNLFRFMHHRIGDVPGTGDQKLRWTIYNYGNLRSFTHGISSPWIDVMVKKFKKVLDTGFASRKMKLVDAIFESTGEEEESFSQKSFSARFRTTANSKNFVKTVRAIKADIGDKWKYRRDLDEETVVDEIADSAWVQRYITPEFPESVLLNTLYRFANLEHGEYFRSAATDHILQLDYSLPPPSDWTVYSSPPPLLYCTPSSREAREP